MPHLLEVQYHLTAAELLDAVNRRFRAKVALEGVVAEVHCERYIQYCQVQGVVQHYEVHDLDGYPDFSIWLTGRATPLKIEVKNVRDAQDAYRSAGQIVAYKVEVQKTRAAQGDASSRYYDADLFQILAVCLGKKTGNWTNFYFVSTRELRRHQSYPSKLAVMHRVPLPTTASIEPWCSSLGQLLQRFGEERQ